MEGTKIPLGDTITLLKHLPPPDTFNREITKCYVHTAAASKATPEGIHRYHTKHKGWSDVGYHFLISKDGTTTVGRPIQRMGAGVKGDNRSSVHVCMLGHGDKEEWTEEQWTAFLDFAHDIWAVYEVSYHEFLGHEECTKRAVKKTCPGKLVDMQDARRRVHHRIRSVIDEDNVEPYPDEDLVC